MQAQVVPDELPFRTATLSPDEALGGLSAPELVERLGALQAVTEAALAHLPLHELLDALLTRVRVLLRTDTATVLLCSGRGDRLVVRASQGLEEVVEDEISVPMGKGLAGTVAVYGRPVIVDDVSRVEVVSQRLRRLSSMMVAPMTVEGRLVGVLHAGSVAPRAFTDAELHLLQVVADRVALAIKKTLLFDDMQRELVLRRKREAELRESERRFRLLVEGVEEYAIFMLDPEGRIASWNPGAERIKGWTAEEAVGRHFSLFYRPEEVARGYPQYELEVAAREGRYEDEGWRVRKDGSHFWANVVITALHEGPELVGFAKITRDLTERRRAEQHREELLVREREARLAAEAAVRARTEFLAVMSHELRTPLTAVLGYADLLLAGIPEPLGAGSAASVQRIVVSARHLLSVIEEILDYVSMEAGVGSPRREHVDLAQLAREAAVLVAPQAGSKGLDVQLDLPAAPLAAVTDAGKARQVLAALLSNAVAFTRRGHVRVELAAAGGHAHFRVRDTGIGIAPEHLEPIFEPFWQVEQSPTRVVGGTGLGLAVARRLAETLGGTLEVESEPHAGSTFTFTLPLQPLPGDGAATPPPPASSPAEGDPPGDG
ncbi:MAG TPA: ATP-binding protein [Longimicrobium sp.]|nr:ATP-binding protein [Longimicrobium sp.]